MSQNINEWAGKGFVMARGHNTIRMVASSAVQWAKSREGENMTRLVNRVSHSEHPVIMVGIYATAAELDDYDDGVVIRSYEPVVINHDRASQLRFFSL